MFNVNRLRFHRNATIAKELRLILSMEIKYVPTFVIEVITADHRIVFFETHREFSQWVEKRLKFYPETTGL